MTLADDPQNPQPSKKLNKSVDAIAALREAMEQRVAEAKKLQARQTAATPTPEPQPEIRPEEPKPDSPPEPTPAPVTEPEPVEPVREPPPPEPKNQAEPIPADPTEWSRIMFHVAERSQKLVLDYANRSSRGTALSASAFDPARLSEAFAGLMNRVVNNPRHFVDAQIALWQGYISIWQSSIARMRGEDVEESIKPATSDKRFQDEEWRNNWMFDLIKQFYLLTAQQMKTLVEEESRQLDPRLARKLEFITRQMTDAASPSNFWFANPEVLREIHRSGGDCLVKGLENLLADLENGKGDLRIRMTDMNAFRIGDNLAATPGRVVYQTELMQLIQYTPTTPDVRSAPVLILPPWINKFYILDLRQANSFVGWLVSQGYTVFCVSWVNPDARHAKIDFEDYMTLGSLAAMREVAARTGTTSINVLGYCIGGTLLASTLAYLKVVPKRPEGVPDILSATYLVTMTDFAEPGDLGIFTDEDFVRLGEERMERQGYLDAAAMSAVFSLLRANDLIWSYVVNNYLLGRDPAAFDILYWNADSTNMPATMQRNYVREMYQQNNLAKPDAYSMKGVPIDLRRVDTPSFLLSTREDHIAPWKSTYAATQVYSGPVTFTLAASGHVAGVVNPPVTGKYGYWTNTNCPASADEWLEGAEKREGSWWTAWELWLRGYSGDMVPARQVPEGLEAAPGSYVKVRVV